MDLRADSRIQYNTNEKSRPHHKKSALENNVGNIQHEDPTTFLDFSFFPVAKDLSDVERVAVESIFDYEETKLCDILLEKSNTPSHPERDGNSKSFGYPLSSQNIVPMNILSLARDMDGIEPISLFQTGEPSHEKKGQKIKPHHEQKWNERFKEFLEFVKENGHGAIPHTYPRNQQLARWVKRQRRQCKLFQEGQLSTITEERLELLTSAGFVFDAHQVSWRAKMDALKKFRNLYHHCMVPTKCKNKGLGMWVKCQRRQYKLYLEGKPSTLNSQRIAELEKLGFEWEVKGMKRETDYSNLDNRLPLV